MGYRDDTTALESRCQVLEQERDRLGQELEQLEAESRQLEQQIRRKRWRLRARRLAEWAGRHKLLTLVLLAAVLLPSYYLGQSYLRERAIRKQTEAFLLRQGCRGWLGVDADLAGATVLLDERKIGVTPLRERVCPGPHLLRVSHPRHVSWQQLVQMPGQGELGFKAELHPLLAENRPASGTLLLSSPAGASVFLDGREVGRTPAFLPEGQNRLGHNRLAVALEGYQPVLLTPRPSPAIWVILARQKDDHGSR